MVNFQGTKMAGEAQVFMRIRYKHMAKWNGLNGKMEVLKMKELCVMLTSFVTSWKTGSS